MTTPAPAGELPPGTAERSRQVRAGLHRVGRLVVEHPWTLTLALCLLVALLGVRGPDFPAQDFRTWLFRTHGWVLWDDQWYGGHPVPGYSLIFPPLAGLLGTLPVGIVSCVASTAFGTGIVRQGQRAGHTLGLLWFAVAVVADLVVGRLPFALGLACGLAAVRAVQTRRHIPAGVAAAGCALASPLAGAFLLLVGLAWAPSLRLRRALPFVGAGLGIAASGAFGQSGVFPFPVVTLAAVLGFVVCGLVLVPRSQRVIRLALALYGASTVLLFAVPNPVGGNMSRLGSLLGGPIAALVLMRLGRRRALAVLAGPLLLWQLAPVTSAVADSSGTDAGNPAYYSGLLSYLQAHRLPLGRLEVPMTRSHWETARIAPYVPLARGWERQLDVVYDAVLYQPHLTASAYRSWLLDNGVRYVALPDAPLDPSSVEEGRLLADGQPWLRPVWHDRHWRLWSVVGARPLSTGAQLTDLAISSFSLHFSAPGTATVRVHASKFWQVTSGTACLLPPTPDGWTSVSAATVGDVTVTAQLRLPAIGPPSTACPDLGSTPPAVRPFDRAGRG